MRITKFARDPRGFYTANVSVDGVTVRVDSSLDVTHSTWSFPVDPKADPGDKRVNRKEVLPAIAKELHSRRRKFERNEPVDETAELPAPTPVRRPNRRPDQAKVIAEQMAAAAQEAIAA